MSKHTSSKPASIDFFEQGKRFMEDLLQENKQLRLRIAGLETDNRDLAKQSSDAETPRLQTKIKLLEDELQQLREDNQQLRNQFSTVEGENREFAQRYVQVERQNSDLISLYVASYQLHITLDFSEVIAAVKEIVINMVGSENFGIFMLDEASQTLAPIAEMGTDGNLPDLVAVGEGPIGTAAASGDVYVEELPAGITRNEQGLPIACIPLNIGEQVTGVIAIYSLLVQKSGFETLDFELFELLGNHAATAIYAAKLYTLSERKRVTLQGFLDILKDEN